METKTILTILTKELGIKGTEKGKNFFFVCPFHDDKHPSLSFEKSKQFFKCFSCNFKASNIVVFWAKFRKITIEKAYEQLALLGYVEGSEYPHAKVKDDKERLVEKFALVSDIYHNNLFTEAGRESLVYLLSQRQLTIKLVERFQLGTAIHSSQLSTLFFDTRNNYRKSDLAATNLFQVVAGQEPYDYFWKKQIIFPIKNERGEVVIFAARKLEGGADNKYIFSPNNHLTNKSSVVYNYDFLREDRNSYCYLVEGFFDVISLTRVGIGNCLSLLGTSISKEQVWLLKKLAKKIVIFLDGDKAGLQATIKIALTLALNNVECEVVENNSDRDPDELCKDGTKEISKLIKRTISPFLFVINYHYSDLKIEENHQRIGIFIKKVADEFKQFRNDTQAFVIRKIAMLTGMTIADVEKIYLPENEAQNEIKILDQENEERTRLEKSVLYYCCESRGTWEELESKEIMFFQQANALAYEKISSFYNSNQLATNFSDFEIDQLFTDFHFSAANKRSAIEKMLVAVANFKNPNL